MAAGAKCWTFLVELSVFLRVRATLKIRTLSLLLPTGMGPSLLLEVTKFLSSLDVLGFIYCNYCSVEIWTGLLLVSILMADNNIKIFLSNANGLNNLSQVPKGNNQAKKRKEAQVIYLQETHLSGQENEK